MTDDKTSAWYRRPPDLSALPREPIPQPHTLIGSDAVPLRVFLRHSAWQDLQTLFDEDATVDTSSQSDATPEYEFDEAHNRASEDDSAPEHDPGVPQRAGILLGNVYEDEQGPYVTIEGALPAPHIRSTSGGLIFTRRTWATLLPVCREHFAEQIVVGSFRVRHNEGTNLSDYDRYVTRRFFPDWWQVTYIIDPSHQRQALFHWQNGGLHSLPGFWVCTVAGPTSAAVQSDTATAKLPTPREEIRHPTEETPAPPEETTAPATEQAAGKLTVARLLPDPTGLHQWTVVALVVVGLLLLALASISAFPGSLPALKRQLHAATALGEQLAAEALALQVRHEQLQYVLTGGTGDPVADAGYKTTTPPPDTVDHYVVRPGDTLWSISTQMLGDPYAYTDLAAENRITNPDLILPGWELRLGKK